MGVGATFLTSKNFDKSELLGVLQNSINDVPKNDQVFLNEIITNFTKNDIGVDAVGEFSPNQDLLTYLLSHSNPNEPIEFGNPADSDSRTVQSVLSEIIGVTGGTQVPVGSILMKSVTGRF